MNIVIRSVPRFLGGVGEYYAREARQNFFRPPKNVGKGPKNNTHSLLSGFKTFLVQSKKCLNKDVTNEDMTFFKPFYKNV